MQKNLINWLALLRTAGVGPVKFKGYLQTDPLLKNLPDLAKATMDHSQRLIERDLAWAQQKDCHIMLLCDDDYPRLLRAIAAPPPVLFIKGSRKILNRSQIAIVGSRHASVTGEQTAFRFAADLANINMVTNSGLAIGIDGASHRGALSEGKGTTIAVLGHGLDIIYPDQHCNLAKSIVSNEGAIVSEFPIGVRPNASNFPRRNRIISGLALGVVVIEASLKSGSLITVNYALEQGREVFAVPGSIYDQNVKGCHQLIRQGAKLVENVSEIVEDLGFLSSGIYSQNKSNKLDCIRAENSLGSLQTKILDSVSYETTATDLIIDRSGLTPSVVNSALVDLELSGYITSVPGGYAKLL